MEPTTRPLALTVISGGGFTFETKRLLQSLADHMDFVYLRTEFGGTPGENGLPPGGAHPVPSFATVVQPSHRQSMAAFAATFAATVRLLRRERIRLVVAVGCSHAIPMFLAARALSCRTAFAESITRVDRLSATGRIVYRLRLADRFVIQWPALQGRYPASRLGTLL